MSSAWRRVIAADGCGHAYIGSQAGDVIAVRLRFGMGSGAAVLETAHSLLVQTNGAHALASFRPQCTATGVDPARAGKRFCSANSVK